jgi:F0F1-type ATP synthase membrane subunit b/b'
MTVVAFDTYELIKKLKDSGFEEPQAEALAEAFVTTHETYLADLVTSQELKDARQELKQEIAQLRQELKQEIAQLRQELKQEIKDLRQEFNQEIKDLRQEFNQEIAQVRQEIKELGLKMDVKYESMKGEITLIKWMMGIVIAGILSLILKAFF